MGCVERMVIDFILPHADFSNLISLRHDLDIPGNAGLISISRSILSDSIDTSTIKTTHSTFSYLISDPKVNLIFSERKGKLTKWRLTEDLKLEKVLDKDTGAILDMKFDQGMQFRWKTSIFISWSVYFLYVLIP